jgi:hypothetical protein
MFSSTMTRVIVRRTEEPEDHLEVLESGAWMRERHESREWVKVRGLMDARPLFERLDAIVGKSPGPAKPGSGKGLIVLSGFRKDPLHFVSGTPGFDEIVSALGVISWELPPGPSDKGDYLRYRWHTSVGCGGDRRVTIDPSGAVEEYRPDPYMHTRIERYRIPREAAAALFAAASPLIVKGQRPRSADFSVESETFDVRVGRRSGWVEAQSPFGSAFQAALLPSPAWAPLIGRVSWRMTVPESGASHQDLDGVLDVGGTATFEVYAPQNYDPQPRYDPVRIDRARTELIFRLASELVDAGSPRDSQRRSEHTQVPQTFHWLIAQRLTPDPEKFLSECSHDHPAFAALERALHEALNCPSTVAEVLAAPVGASIRTRASVMEVDGLRVLIADRTGKLTGALPEVTPALQEQLSALGLVDATVRVKADGLAFEEFTLVRRGLVLIRDSEQPRGKRTLADLEEFLKQEDPHFSGLAERWGRETLDVGSPSTWVWRLDDGAEAWVTAPGRGRIRRLVLFPRGGDPQVLRSVTPS